MRRFLALAALVGLASLFACGGDSEDGTPANAGGSAGSGGGAPNTPTITGLAPLVAEVFCNAMQQCVGPAYPIFFEGVDCKQQFALQMTDGSLEATEDAVTKGTIAYHPEKAQECLDAFKALGCTIFTSRAPGVCEQVIEGKVAAGGECTLHSECAGDLYCKADTACPGKCTPRETSGGTCRDDDSCESGLKCGGASKKCEKPGGTGEACGLTNPGCTTTHICIGADEDNNKPGTCKPMSEVFSAKAGAECNLIQGPYCEAGQSCVVKTIAPLAFECQAEVAAGAACRLGAPDPCPHGQYCADTDVKKGDVDGTCKDGGAEGQPCAGDLGANSCASGLTCGAVSRTCYALQRIGSPCAHDDACYSGRCTGGMCAAGDSCP